ncbi:hypothetical protein [Qipengyuania flava]|uniref:hypothetical protein n=1 Tax=Qipengyuania flava TaxID=192812 RepID=UPI001C628FC3|nr:hypothetical protein [Qipengyuania flava]QYJ07067.1 hypothetical protein KUV82_13685 [Qipengyuania flava]
MTIHDDGAHAVHDRFDRVEALLSRYPEVAEAELAELKRWFSKEASAFEVASLASKDELRSRYCAFRADHVDKIGTMDMLAIVCGTVLLLGAIAWFAMAG